MLKSRAQNCNLIIEKYKHTEYSGKDTSKYIFFKKDKTKDTNYTIEVHYTSWPIEGSREQNLGVFCATTTKSSNLQSMITSTTEQQHETEIQPVFQVVNEYKCSYTFMYKSNTAKLGGKSDSSDTRRSEEGDVSHPAAGRKSTVLPLMTALKPLFWFARKPKCFLLRWQTSESVCSAWTAGSRETDGEQLPTIRQPLISDLSTESNSNTVNTGSGRQCGAPDYSRSGRGEAAAGAVGCRPWC